ncbi:MAG TPA: hypothetical protein VND64_09970 [Pirellulales bacterium]|nr:hypothetical protein [Pirellulales bacterium]
MLTLLTLLTLKFLTYCQGGGGEDEGWMKTKGGRGPRQRRISPGAQQGGNAKCEMQNANCTSKVPNWRGRVLNWRGKVPNARGKVLNWRGDLAKLVVYLVGAAAWRASFIFRRFWNTDQR